ncbi:MAG TPA: hypothetical protein VGP61_00725 [Gemmatimonadales bacterium]|nr:hypothetical protein [Gemmatimonadales bacterium]
MGPGLLTSLLALASFRGAFPPDTSTYSSAAARELIARASVRHHAQDSSVSDYQAKLRYRLTVSLGRRRWGNAPPFLTEEQEAKLSWQLPNDLRVDIVGQRSRSREENGQILSGFDSPWFVPRGLSDSVRFFGNDFPDRAALHPLATDGPEWYRYSLGDTVSLGMPDGRRIRLVEVQVIPKRAGPALIAGRLWLDVQSAEVVRLAFRYVGTALWETPSHPTASDSASARRANKIINKILSLDTDLEYALQEGRYWMPYRQVLSGQLQVPLVSDIYVPFEATTTFSDYEINTGQKVAFRLEHPNSARQRTREERIARRDSLRAERRSHGQADSSTAREHAGLMPGGGRYEIHRAPRDSLHRYAEWGDSLQLRLSAEDERHYRETKQELADLAERLPRGITGINRTGFAYERLADAFRFNRVQGTSLGFGYQLDLPALSYSSLFGTFRFGFADKHPTARVSLVRDAPSGKLTFSLYHDLSEADPWSHGLSAANAVRALLSARDEADYYRATGVALSVETAASRSVELTLAGRVERERSAETEAKAWLNDAFGGSGIMAPNPPIREGDFGALLARLEGRVGRARWQLSADGLSDLRFAAKTARIYGEWRQPIGIRTGLTLRARAGIATRPTLPQLGYRAGGQGSVRGYDYGTERGAAFWALQSDLTPWRGAIRPVLFLDAAQAGQPDSLGHTRVLLGGGGGVSFFKGLLRFDLSHPLSYRPAGSGLRFDVVFGAAR